MKTNEEPCTSQPDVIIRGTPTYVLQLLSRLLDSLLELFPAAVLVGVPEGLGPGDGHCVPLVGRAFPVLVGDGVVDVVAAVEGQVGGREGLDVGLHEALATAD